MSRALRSTAKRLAQKMLRRGDVRGFLRTRQLWLSKKIYRRQITVSALRQRLIDLGVTPGRTLWVQSSWNEFFNVAMRPGDVINLLRDLLGPSGTLVMPAFPIDKDPSKRDHDNQPSGPAGRLLVDDAANITCRSHYIVGWHCILQTLFLIIVIADASSEPASDTPDTYIRHIIKVKQNGTASSRQSDIFKLPRLRSCKLSSCSS